MSATEKPPEYLAAEARILAFRDASNAVFDALDARAREMHTELDAIEKRYGISPKRRRHRPPLVLE